jgi:MFS family permease
MFLPISGGDDVLLILPFPRLFRMSHSLHFQCFSFQILNTSFENMSDNEKALEAVNAASPEPYTIYTTGQKGLIIALVAVAATFSGFAGNIYFPAIPSIVDDLSVSAELVNLTVTSYMIFQGLAPSIWGAVADVHGRRITYICTFMVFIGACIGLAETRHYYQLVILRCLQSAGSASTIAIGSGVVGDITRREERGGYMGIYQSALLSPVAIGPIIGGVLAQTLGWHSIFWFLTIYAGVFLAVMIVVLPETLRSIVGNGSKPAKGLSLSLLSYIQLKRHPESRPHRLERTTSSGSVTKRLSVDVLGPLKIICSIEVTLVIIFMSIYYTVWQMVIASLSTLFKRTYHLTELQIGLTFLGNGLGCIVGTLTTGKFLDFDYRRFKSKFTGEMEDFPLDKSRLRTVWLWAPLQIASVLVFGWTLRYSVHLSVPIICTFVLGWSATSIISAVSTLMVDIYPTKSASATAALNLVRCLMGAGGTAAVLPIVSGIGVGWTFTLLVGVMIASLGLVVVQIEKGVQWRKKRAEKELQTGTPSS